MAAVRRDIHAEFALYGITLKHGQWEDKNPHSGWILSNGDIVKNDSELKSYLANLKSEQ